MTKKKTRKERSAENKRKWADRKKKKAKKPKAKKPAAKKPAAEKPAAEKPAVEKSDVKLTPWPQAGTNPEFEDIIGKATPAEQPADEPKEPTEEPAVLKIKDVAEWVKWPFQFWATSQGLPPIIKPEEAIEIAEPVTRILNRHGVCEYIPPDVIDGMQVVGRTAPVVKRGSNMVKVARKRRAAGQGKDTEIGVQGRRPVPQGAPLSKPQSV